jgi:hypothetical protein
MIHCPRCGRQNDDELRYCLGCGTDLAKVRALLAHTSLAGFSSSSTLPTVPPPPREPTARTRGLIYAYTGRQLVFRVLGSVFVVIGLVLFAAIGHRLVYDVLLDVNGVPGKAKVTSIKADPSTQVNGVHPRIISFVTIPDGMRGHSATLNRNIEAKPGEIVDVDLLPSFEEAARVHGTMCSVLGYFAAFPLVFVGVGLPLLLAALRSNRREVRAFRFGTSTIGRVTRFALDPRVSMNGKNPTALAWEFDVGGKTYSGSMSHMDARVLRPLVVNERVPVVYDAKDPSVNTIYVV